LCYFSIGENSIRDPKA